MSERAVVFFAYHRIHVYTFARLFARLTERGCRVVCAVFEEHVRNGQVEPDLLRSLEPRCRLEVLPKGLVERAVSRVPGVGRDRRWAWRAGRLLRRVGEPVAAVVVPLDHPGRYIGGRTAADTRFVAVQYEPFIQHHKTVRIAGLEADLLCTWGELDSTALRRSGARSPILATGSPIVDPVPEIDFASLERRQRLRFLYTTTPLLRKRRLEFAVRLPYTREDYASMKRRAIRDLHYLTERLPGAEVTVKLHPFDEGSLERELLAEIGSESLTLAAHQPDVPIQSFVERCDILVTMSSTTAFQALAAGRPVVLLNYDNWAGKHEQNYLAYAFALTAIDGPSLEWAVRKTIFDEETREMLGRNRAAYLARVADCWGEESVEATCRAILGETPVGAAGAEPEGEMA